MQIVLVILAVLFIIPVLAGWFLSRKIEVVESRVINAIPNKVFDTIKDLHTWQEWSAWSTHNDDSLEVSFGSRTSGKNASMEWKGRKLGEGELRIDSLKSNREVHLESGFHKGRFRVTHHIATHPNGTETLVVWKATVTTKWSSVARLLGRLFMRRLRRDMSISLQLLDQVCR